MSKEHVQRRDLNESTFTGPTLVASSDVLDISEARRSRIHEEESSHAVDTMAPHCNDGVCVLSWRPVRRTSEDVA